MSEKLVAYTAKSILEEPDAEKAMKMNCMYPGCYSKTRTVNTAYCDAHRKRFGEIEESRRKHGH